MLAGCDQISTGRSADLEQEALIAAGVDARHIHRNRLSGSRGDRPGLGRQQFALRPMHLASPNAMGEIIC
jgi:hypothetical protein